MWVSQRGRKEEGRPWRCYGGHVPGTCTREDGFGETRVGASNPETLPDLGVLSLCRALEEAGLSLVEGESVQIGNEAMADRLWDAIRLECIVKLVCV